jgi:hypothetical protein
VIKNDDNKYYPYESSGEKVAKFFFALYIGGAILGLLLWLIR